jgi:hypothetical protein
MALLLTDLQNPPNFPPGEVSLLGTILTRLVAWAKAPLKSGATKLGLAR